MSMWMRARVAAHGRPLVLFLAALGLPGMASAADPFPSKAVRIVVPFSPGGTNDTVGRLLAERLAPLLGQPVVIENRGGAATNIGTEFVARSAPDGYTLLLGSSSSAANVTLYPKLPFDLRRDFAPVSLVATTSQMLFVHPSVPVRTVREFVALARSRPGELTYASAGIAGPPHLAGELFKSLAKVNVLHVPYRGGGEAVVSVLSGQTTSSFAGTTSALPHVRAGRLRALGITTAKRVRYAPDLPTIAEAGVPGYEMSGWIALFAPAATSADVVTRLNRATVAALDAAQLRQRLQGAAIDAESSTPAELEKFLLREIEKYAKVIREAGIRPE